MEPDKNIQIFIRTAPYSAFTSGYGIVYQDGTLHQDPERDFYINLLVTRTSKVWEYVETQSDNNVYTVNRQKFNPYYIELGFFDTVADDATIISKANIYNIAISK